MGSGGFYNAKNLNVFILPEQSAQLCAEITFIFRDHGARAERTKCRLAFLLATIELALYEKTNNRKSRVKLCPPPLKLKIGSQTSGAKVSLMISWINILLVYLIIFLNYK